MQLQNPTLFRQHALINNEWKSGSLGDISVTNPFSGDKIGNIPSLSVNEVKQAVEFAKTAQKTWAAMTSFERAKILHQWADLIDAHIDDLAHIMTCEQGKPIRESKSEIDYANSFIRWFAEEGKRIYGDTIGAKNNQLRHIVLKQPIGVCAAITPWNFPAAMMTRKVAPALAAGCTMIVRPDSQTPFCALALGELALQAGMPPAVLQIVTGDAKTIGSVFTKNTCIKKLSFTGSTKVGKLLMEQSASSLKKLSLELGGNAPFIVFEDANIDKAIEGVLASKYRNAGQTCVCANRIYVQKGIYHEFMEKLKQKVNLMSVGNGLDNPDIGCLINHQAMQKTQELLQDALNQGATLITGGTPHQHHNNCFLPTIITDITQQMRIAHEEIFAPIAAIYPFDDEDEVIRWANDTQYGLAAYFYTNNHARAWRVTEQLEYGMVAQNTGMLSTEVAPFGGIKESGFGREGSKYGIEEYVVTKYWCLDITD